MTAGAGSVRSAASLAATAARLAELAAADDGKKGVPKSWETTNLLHVGQALTLAAVLREERAAAMCGRTSRNATTRTS